MVSKSALVLGMLILIPFLLTSYSFSESYSGCRLRKSIDDRSTGSEAMLEPATIR